MTFGFITITIEGYSGGNTNYFFSSASALIIGFISLGLLIVFDWLTPFFWIILVGTNLSGLFSVDMKCSSLKSETTGFSYVFACGPPSMLGTVFLLRIYLMRSGLIGFIFSLFCMGIYFLSGFKKIALLNWGGSSGLLYSIGTYSLRAILSFFFKLSIILNEFLLGENPTNFLVAVQNQLKFPY